MDNAGGHPLDLLYDSVRRWNSSLLQPKDVGSQPKDQPRCDPCLLRPSIHVTLTLGQCNGHDREFHLKRILEEIHHCDVPYCNLVCSQDSEGNTQCMLEKTVTRHNPQLSHQR